MKIKPQIQIPAYQGLQIHTAHLNLIVVPTSVPNYRFFLPDVHAAPSITLTLGEVFAILIQFMLLSSCFLTFFKLNPFWKASFFASFPPEQFDYDFQQQSPH